MVLTPKNHQIPLGSLNGLDFYTTFGVFQIKSARLLGVVTAVDPAAAAQRGCLAKAWSKAPRVAGRQHEAGQSGQPSAEAFFL